MTLKVPMTPSSDVWYRQLETDRNFTITYGEDGTGDVYKSANLEALKTLVEKEEINIFVSDGGFRIRKNEKVYKLKSCFVIWIGWIRKFDQNLIFPFLISINSPVKYTV